MAWQKKPWWHLPAEMATPKRLYPKTRQHEKIPLRLSIFLFTKKVTKIQFLCLHSVQYLWGCKYPKLPPKIQKNGVPCKIPCSLAIKNRRPSPMPKIALSHKQNCNQFVKERNILFNICQCTTTSIWIFELKNVHGILHKWDKNRLEFSRQKCNWYSQEPKKSEVSL